MKQFITLLFLIALSCPPPAHAGAAGNSADQSSAEQNALVNRLQEVLTRTEKRIREVFGFKLRMKALVEPSQPDFDFLVKLQEPSGDPK